MKPPSRRDAKEKGKEVEFAGNELIPWRLGGWAV
jgi:hypothetical protein